MAANGSGRIKMNVGRLLRILFFAQDLPVASFFLPMDLPVAPTKNKSLTNKIWANLPAGKKKGFQYTEKVGLLTNDGDVEPFYVCDFFTLMFNTGHPCQGV
jgi:hypothetical protein